MFEFTFAKNNSKHFVFQFCSASAPPRDAAIVYMNIRVVK